LRTPKAEIRVAEPGDAEAIVETVQGSFEGYRTFAPPGWVPPEERRHLDAMREQPVHTDTFCRVAEVEGEPAGHVWVRPVVGADPVDLHLRYLFVRPLFWGTGVARDLHAAAVEHIGERSARLFTPAGQARARRFYEREGWRLIDVGDFANFGMDVAE
jgi:predicted N-acetyltransferase YhbS